LNFGFDESQHQHRPSTEHGHVQCAPDLTHPAHSSSVIDCSVASPMHFRFPPRQFSQPSCCARASGGGSSDGGSSGSSGSSSSSSGDDDAATAAGRRDRGDRWRIGRWFFAGMLNNYDAIIFWDTIEAAE